MRRGQAAVEYLVTYAWAFIAIIVLLGALGYYGLLNPGRYMAGRCDFGLQLACVDYRFAVPGAPQTYSGLVDFRLVNQFGDDINITNVFVNDLAVNLLYDDSLSVAPGWQAIPAQGVRIQEQGYSPFLRARVFIASGLINFTTIRNERIVVPVTIEYMRDLAGSPRHNITGEIYTLVR